MAHPLLLLLCNLLVLQQIQLVRNAAIRNRNIPDPADMGNMQIGPPADARHGRQLGPDGPPLVRQNKAALKHGMANTGVRGHAIKLNDDSDKQIEQPLHAEGPKRNQPRDRLNIDGAPIMKLKERRKSTVLNIQPPDHLEAVRMHQDGDLNHDYKREIFLGLEDHHHDDDENAEPILPKIFKLADKNADNYLSIDEMTDWIVLKVEEHFKEASDVNQKIFRMIDTNGDGYVTWAEFRNEYLMAKGYKLLPDDLVEKQGIKEAYNLPEKDVLLLSKYETRWDNADAQPEDSRLDVNEFKSFRHPEQNAGALNDMVEDILRNIDDDGDRIITEDEFVALPPGEVVDFKDSDKEWQEDRRQEFRKVIDFNHDGRVDAEELQLYVDPRNRNHARLEAENLVGLADMNNDNKLSLQEVLDNKKLFLGSKMVNTGQNFHDEF